MAINGMGCQAIAHVMGIGLNTILRHLTSSAPNHEMRIDHYVNLFMTTLPKTFLQKLK
ncbi:IS1-like element transposase [Photorhabdus viridis]